VRCTYLRTTISKEVGTSSGGITGFGIVAAIASHYFTLLCLLIVVTCRTVTARIAKPLASFCRHQDTLIPPNPPLASFCFRNASTHHNRYDQNPLAHNERGLTICSDPHPQNPPPSHQKATSRTTTTTPVHMEASVEPAQFSASTPIRTNPLLGLSTPLSGSPLLPVSPPPASTGAAPGLRLEQIMLLLVLLLAIFVNLRWYLRR
jgi:hypothetical protein